MDYSKLSDRDIDALVLQEIYGNQAKDKDIMRAWFRGEFRYATNPADAWPIIVDNEISLISRCANGEWKAQLHLGRDDIFDSYASCWDIKPLRAAMIVFLMMKEQSHE